MDGGLNCVAQCTECLPLAAHLLHDNNALVGGSINIHIVHTGPSSPNNFEIISSIYNVRCYLGRRSNNKAIVVLKCTTKHRVIAEFMLAVI